MKLAIALAATASLALYAQNASAQQSSGPTCSDLDFLGIDVHGQHIVRDYVLGGALGAIDWPPGGIGETVSANGGAAVPGGPGPGFHFLNGVPPGASFCNPQAQSWHSLDD